MEAVEKRLLENNEFSNIKLSYVSRIDLIRLKVAAFYYRYPDDQKDYQDLISLKINRNELGQAIDFLKEKHLFSIHLEFHTRYFTLLWESRKVVAAPIL